MGAQLTLLSEHNECLIKKQLCWNEERSNLKLDLFEATSWTEKAKKHVEQVHNENLQLKNDLLNLKNKEWLRTLEKSAKDDDSMGNFTADTISLGDDELMF